MATAAAAGSTVRSEAPAIIVHLRRATPIAASPARDAAAARTMTQPPAIASLVATARRVSTAGVAAASGGVSGP
ncbi:hypothetical protein ACQP2P_28235 [Dactylosporangium sp. CA-139114]|uniref:hypothetical protein n=1 Tax=Dactylosporangium sp. CA-139114 TaxID=3239931 RepID=UPI003D99E2C8